MKKKSAKNSKKKTNGSWAPSLPRPALNIKAETARSIWAILAAIAALLFILAAIGKAGTFGDFLYRSLKEGLFGFGYYLLPVSFLILAVGLFRQRDPQGFGGTRIIGASILFLSGLALLSIAGEYGGVVGHGVAYPFVSLFAELFATVVLVALALVGGLLALDTPITLSSFIRQSEVEEDEDEEERPRKKKKPGAGKETVNEETAEEAKAEIKNAFKRTGEASVKIMRVAKKMGGSYDDVAEGIEGIAELAEKNPLELKKIFDQIEKAKKKASE